MKLNLQDTMLEWILFCRNITFYTSPHDDQSAELGDEFRVHPDGESYVSQGPQGQQGHLACQQVHK